jgi:hypothetical protein
MAAKKTQQQTETRDLDNTVGSLRFARPEAERYWNLIDEIRQHPYGKFVGKSDVMRDLLKLNDPPLILTAGQILYFQTGEKTPKKKTKLKESSDVLVPMKVEKIGGKKPSLQKQKQRANGSRS